jgi:hypothetical protein
MSGQRPDPIKVPSVTPRGLKRGETPREKRKRIWQTVRKNIAAVAEERRRLFAKNAEYCKLCIMDAFQGRLSNGLANNSKKSWWIYTIFRIQTSEILFRCVIGACIFHTLSLFFEPENACANSWVYTTLQVLVILIYGFDIAMKMSYEGVQEYFSHDWQQLYFIVAVFGAVDLAFNHCTVYSNPLRPVVGVLRARKGRRFFEVLKKMMPGTCGMKRRVKRFLPLAHVHRNDTQPGASVVLHRDGHGGQRPAVRRRDSGVCQQRVYLLQLVLPHLHKR